VKRKPSPIQFNNTVLRDGHQSLAATRMSTAQMLTVAPLLDQAGFAGLETWGGATIDACLRFLGENPFDRLRALKQAAPNTPQLMLLRGRNIVQYSAFPDDIVETFVRCAASAGCDVFRIFDALNDPDNLRCAVQAVRAAGRHARGEICYTISPAHTLEKFLSFGRELAAMGCHSLAIKDMSGVLAPVMAAKMVSGLKAESGLPVTVHSHDTAGLAGATYLAAIDAGADAVETSIAPFANGTAQPDTVRMLAMLEGHPRRPGHFDPDLLFEIRGLLEGIYNELREFTDSANDRTDPDILAFQIPGGMLSNFRVQLKDLNMSDRINEVMREIPVVREALGWIPLVTPTSQIVGTQAMLNVKFGRWKNIAPAAMDIASGKFGRTPGPVDPGLLALAPAGQSPADADRTLPLPPGMPALREKVAAAGLPVTDEACVLFAMFPQQTAAWFRGERPAAPVTAHPTAIQTTAPPLPAAPAAPAGAGVRRMRISIGGISREALVETVS
jgi:oxaloacetate decarboxylase alpha subunit/pyruvate carboxylase subunit B